MHQVLTIQLIQITRTIQQIQAAEARIAQLQEQLEENANSNSNLQARIEELQDQLGQKANSNSKIQAAEGTIAQLQEQLGQKANSNSKIQAAEARIAQLQAEAKALRDKAANANTARAEAQAQVKEVQEMKKQLDLLASQITQKDEAIEGLEAKLAEFEEAHEQQLASRLTNVSDSYKTRMNALQSEVSRLESTIVGKNRDVQRNKNASQSQKEQMETEITRIQAEKDAKDLEVKALKAEMAEQVGNLRGALAAMKSEKNAKNRLNRNTKEATNSQMANISAMLEAMKAEREGLRRALRGLEKENATLRFDLEEKIQQIADLEAELQHYRAQADAQRQAEAQRQAQALAQRQRMPVSTEQRRASGGRQLKDYCEDRSIPVEQLEPPYNTMDERTLDSECKHISRTRSARGLKRRNLRTTQKRR